MTRTRGSSRVLRRSLIVIAPLFSACPSMLEPSDNPGTGWIVHALNDVDGDKCHDFAIRSQFDISDAGAWPSLWVVSGSSGLALYEIPSDSTLPTDPYPGTFVVESIEDVNGDGRSDFALGLPGHRSDGAGAVELRSGADGALLWRHDGLVPHGRFGCALARLGDLDRDGVCDLAVTESGSSLDGITGCVWAISSRSSEMLWIVREAKIPEPFDHFPDNVRSNRFGAGLCVLPDIDGHGVLDLAIGSMQGPGQFDLNGSVSARSGKDGRELWHRTGEPSQFLGIELVRCDDRNGDGFDDLMAGAAMTQRVVLSSRTGVVLAALPPRQHEWPIGDVDGDGTADVGASTDLRPGSVELRSGANAAALASIEVPAGFESLDWGHPVVALGDLDGDRATELASAANRKLVFDGGRWRADHGVVRIHDVKRGTTRATIDVATLRAWRGAGLRRAPPPAKR